MTGYQRAGNNQEERCAGDQQRETKYTLVHEPKPLPVASLSHDRQPVIKLSLVSAQHREFDCRHHLEPRSCRGNCCISKREVCFTCAISRHGDFHRLLGTGCSTLFMPCGDRVLAWWNLGDGERAVCTTHCEQRVLENANVSFHPGMLVAFDWNQH